MDELVTNSPLHIHLIVMAHYARGTTVSPELLLLCASGD